MIIENCFQELENKYGDNFCWYRVNEEHDKFEVEAYREIGKEHPLFGMTLNCLAKSEKNDNVLFYTEYGQFVVIHLTYSENNVSGYPKYQLLDTHQELKEYWEQEVQNDR